MRYPIVIRRTATGYSVDAPDLPGCVATGTTVEHARQQMTEAVEMHLDLMARAGETAPRPSLEVQFAIDQDASEELCNWVEVDESRDEVSILIENR